MKNRIITLLTAFSILFSFSSCTKNHKEKINIPSQASDEITKESELSVTVFDVGKADAMVIQTENHSIVMDCGEKGDGKIIVEFLNNKGIQTVDYIIITHFDKDHVGGAAKIINELEVKNILVPDYAKESEEISKYNKAVSNSEITPTIINTDLTFQLDNAEFNIIAPKQSFNDEENENDYSLVTKITHRENILLFTGDATEERLDEIMGIGKCDFLKIPYHGRKIKNLGEFLDSVSPEKAVICTSKDELSSDTQKKLTKRNIEFFSTCYNGEIRIISDGNNITMIPEKGV